MVTLSLSRISSVSGALTAVDVEELSRDERSLLEVEHAANDVVDLAMRPTGCRAA
jgi:hypothetical protein